MGNNFDSICKTHTTACMISIAYFLGSALYELGMMLHLNSQPFWSTFVTITAILSIPYYVTTVFFVPYALVTIVYMVSVFQFIHQVKFGPSSTKYIMTSLVTILICNLGMRNIDYMTSGMTSLNIIP